MIREYSSFFHGESAMAMLAETIDQALNYHRAGDLDRAEQLYRQVLAADPRQADVWFYLGEAYLVRGRSEDAASCYQRAVEVMPSHAAALNSLGVVFAQQNQTDHAIWYFREAVRVQPNHAEAHNNLGIVLANKGNLMEAELSYRQALQLRPAYPEANSNLGLVLRTLERNEEAATVLRQAIASKPDFANAHNNLGTVLENMGELDEAAACYRRAMQLAPRFPEAANNLGVVLFKIGQYPESQTYCRQAIAMNPNYGDAYHNLGNALVSEGKLAEGAASFQQALRLMPQHADVHFGLALAYLLQGDFPRGWAEFEWRWQRKVLPPRPFQQPQWDGSPLAGRTILLHAEQGFGDTIQFSRYAPLVKARGGRVVLECQPALVSLIATCRGIDQIVARNSPLPHFDVQAALLSLPRILGTTLATVPAEIPYLTADPAQIERWRQELAGTPGFRIGIAWQGNPRHVNDLHRSCPLHHFERLARVQGVRLFSLQKGPGAEQLAAVAERWPLIDLGSRLETFQDTAGLLKNLDLVISVDSVAAHCAAALGLPAWMLLPFAPDWRWMLNREDTPWYPTMRLFRQGQPCKWDGAFERVAGALEKEVAKRNSASEPTRTN
jgi:Tfp pilus assembly protein PilF